jgi:hypothetical protein
MRHRRDVPPIQGPSSAFTGFRFPPDVILVAVRWYLRYGLSYRDLEELLSQRGIDVDHGHCCIEPAPRARRDSWPSSDWTRLPR